MPTIKIADLPDSPIYESYKEICMHPEHNPPMHISLSPGIYRHICPGCGNTQEFTVGITFTFKN